MFVCYGCDNCFSGDGDDQGIICLQCRTATYCNDCFTETHPGYDVDERPDDDQEPPWCPNCDPWKKKRDERKACVDSIGQLMVTLQEEGRVDDALEVNKTLRIAKDVQQRRDAAEAEKKERDERRNKRKKEEEKQPEDDLPVDYCGEEDEEGEIVETREVKRQKTEDVSPS
jgi:hypothetical protein